MRAHLRLIAAPTLFAVRRMRARPFSVLTLTLALAGAGALIGWSSATAALSHEKSTRLQLEGMAPGLRSFGVVYYTLPGEGDYRARPVAAAFRGFADVTGRAHRVRIWHSLDPNNPLGIRLVIAGEPRADVRVTAGRLPSGCRGRVCESLTLRGRASIGRRIALGHRRFARIVGRGSLRPGRLPDASQLGGRALLVRSLPRSFRRLVATDGSTVVYGAVIDPRRVHGFAVSPLSRRFKQAIGRLERGDPLLTATAPVGVLDGLAKRAEVARERLLIVAGEAAALIIAFAAFVASTRRRETELVDEQITTLGASRTQAWVLRCVEAFVPGIAGVLLAVVGLWAAMLVVAERRGLPRAFVSHALPTQTLVVIGCVGAAGALLLLAARSPRRPSRLRAGALELAALTALAVIVWQTWTTGALDADRLAADGATPVLLLVPALGFFGSAVVLLRLLPPALRVGERLTRRAPFGVRLAVLTAARNPTQAAATTTFLAVALGSSLFSLDYRATLEQQARDQATFDAGASWRVLGRGLPSQRDVTPLTRFASVSTERATPALRLDGDLLVAARRGAPPPVNVLALPAARVPDLLGWRRSFAALSRDQIARRLRPVPVRMTGPTLAGDARALRVWARARTDYPRAIVLHLLLPGQRFAHVRLGVAGRRWRLLRLPLGRPLRNTQLIGVEFAPTKVPIDFKYDPKGFVELGPLEQRRPAGWSPLRSLATWAQSTAPDGTSGILNAWSFKHAPVRSGIRFDLNGTFQPLIHPSFGLPDALSGFRTGALPALVSGPVAAQAVDGLVTLDLPGAQIPVRVVGRAGLFPTIVSRARSFVVLDYDTLFAALNADQPGLAVPSEAWFFRSQAPGFASRLAALAPPPGRALGVETIQARLLSDPLAAGTRGVLTVTAFVAALLGLAGLVLAVRSTLASERLLLAEYEALGVPPLSLRRAAQLRLVALSALGIAAGLAGAFLSVRLIAAFVAVTGTATRPLPPIVPVVPWPAVASIVAAVGVAAITVAALLAGRSLRESAARRLRA